MEQKMNEGRRKKYRRFTLTRGDQYGASVARDLDLERWLDCDAQGVHVAMVDPAGHAPSEAFAAIARDIQHPWRAEGRRILEAVLAGVADEKVDELPFVYVRFIQRCRELKRQGLLKVRVIGTTSPTAPSGVMAKPMLVTGEVERPDLLAA